nr:unnamed protein product [Callosobruchus analis]
MKTLYQLNLISNKKDEREECKSIINIFESFDFLMLVTFFSSLFEITNPVSTALQHENNDLQKSSLLEPAQQAKKVVDREDPDSAEEEHEAEPMPSTQSEEEADEKGPNREQGSATYQKKEIEHSEEMFKIKKQLALHEVELCQIKKESA